MNVNVNIVHNGKMMMVDTITYCCLTVLVNSEEKAVLQISSLEDFSLRGKSWGGGGMVVDNSCYSSEIRLFAPSADITIYLYAMTCGLTFAYDIENLNCHTTSTWLATGILANSDSDITFMQRMTEIFPKIFNLVTGRRYSNDQIKTMMMKECFLNVSEEKVDTVNCCLTVTITGPQGQGERDCEPCQYWIDDEPSVERRWTLSTDVQL